MEIFSDFKVVLKMAVITNKSFISGGKSAGVKFDQREIKITKEIPNRRLQITIAIADLKEI